MCMHICAHVQVLEHVLNALIALIWNSPKNRIRMSNKEVMDLEVLTKFARMCSLTIECVLLL